MFSVLHTNLMSRPGITQEPLLNCTAPEEGLHCREIVYPVLSNHLWFRSSSSCWHACSWKELGRSPFTMSNQGGLWLWSITHVISKWIKSRWVSNHAKNHVTDETGWQRRIIESTLLELNPFYLWFSDVFRGNRNGTLV